MAISILGISDHYSSPVIPATRATVTYGGGRRPSYWLEGIYIRDRPVAVYSDKGYGAFWERETENEPQLKIGVNLVVFALTQKGSIAQQQIDFYNQAGQ